MRRLARPSKSPFHLIVLLLLLLLALAPPRAGAAYPSHWWHGTTMAMGLILLGSVALVFAARAGCSRAKPTAVFTDGAVPPG